MGVRRNYARETRCTDLIVLYCDRNTGVSDKQLLSPLVIWEGGGGVVRRSKSCSLFEHRGYTLYIPPGLTLRRLMSYIYGAPILDVSRSHTTTQHSR